MVDFFLTILCKEIRNDHEFFFLYRTKVLKRVVELNDDMNVVLLQKHKSPRFSDICCDDK